MPKDVMAAAVASHNTQIRPVQASSNQMSEVTAPLLNRSIRMLETINMTVRREAAMPNAKDE